MYKLVQCPDSEEVELVECVETPLGNLIHRCTRFRPSCAMKCSRACAIQLDRATRECCSPLQLRDDQVELELEEEEEADTL